VAAGYAGLDNDLFYMDKTMMVFGDAKKVIEDMVKAVEWVNPPVCYSKLFRTWWRQCFATSLNLYNRVAAYRPLTQAGTARDVRSVDVGLHVIVTLDGNIPERMRGKDVELLLTSYTLGLGQIAPDWAMERDAWHAHPDLAGQSMTDT
jgi:hypothetical protein